MENILSPPRSGLLQEYARSRVLLGFDFDGTLAPLTAFRSRAALLPETRALFQRLASQYPCVVLSGRSRPDVMARVRGIDVRECLGCHGVEPSHATAAVRRRVARWLGQLGPALRDVPGVVLEDKRYCLAIHYRHSPDRRRARRRIIAAAGALESARVTGGKCVVNVVPAEAPHKGEALRLAMARLRCRGAIYLGDDETDEDVFGLETARRILGIRVGASRRSRAAYYVPRRDSVDRVMAALLASRADRRAPRAARG